MDTTTLTVTHRFAASAERVFDAFLDPEKAAKFMFVTETGQITRCEIDARVGGKYVITDRRDGEDVAHEGEFLEIDRPKRLVFTLSAKKYGPDVDRVTIDIAPLESGCELRLTHAMRADWEDRKDQVAAGWSGILGGLAAVVGKGGLYVEKSIMIDAAASKVWRALTDSKLTRQWIETWWADVVLRSDWNPGDPVVWRMTDGEIGAQGTVAQASPPALLRFTFRVNMPGSAKEEVIAYHLQESDGRTTLSVSIGDFGDTPEHEQCYPGTVEAWDLSLPKIKELAEG